MAVLNVQDLYKVKQIVHWIIPKDPLPQDDWPRTRLGGVKPNLHKARHV